MKEATSELNMTVVVVISIAGLAAFFYMTLWPMIQNNVNRSTKCTLAICANQKNDDGSVNCTYTDKSGKTTELKCAWKG